MWLDLSLPPLAAIQALPRDQREAAGEALDAQQTAVMGRVRALGGQELARVRVVRNAIAVLLPTGRLAEAGAIDGVVRIRALQHRMRTAPPASAASGGLRR